MYGVGLGIGVWAGSRDQCRDGCMGWGVGISVWARCRDGCMGSV